ncbi:hypothetical protein HanIR_Chr06g0265321 [Helianthus annuus]|nr:hypothetical protein HanIR_Chr06g0265321 [Helianthus annuus]
MMLIMGGKQKFDPKFEELDSVMWDVCETLLSNSVWLRRRVGRTPPPFFLAHALLPQNVSSWCCVRT